jgi:hypothetical protein
VRNTSAARKIVHRALQISEVDVPIRADRRGNIAVPEKVLKRAAVLGDLAHFCGERMPSAMHVHPVGDAWADVAKLSKLAVPPPVDAVRGLGFAGSAHHTVSRADEPPLFSGYNR